MTAGRNGWRCPGRLIGAAVASLLLLACRGPGTAAAPTARSPLAVAESLQRLGRNDSAVVLYAHLRDSLRVAGDSAGLWNSTLWGGYGLMRLGRRDSAGALIREALHLARSPGESAWSHSILSNWWDQQGRFDSALSHATRARALAQADSDPELRHSAAVSLGRIYVRTGRYRESLALHESTVVAERQLRPERLGLVASDLNEACIDYERLGQLAESAARCDEGLAVARRAGARDELSRLLLNRGVTYADAGDQERAESLYRVALDAYTANRNVRGMAIAHSDLGEVYRAAHNTPLARREYLTADSIARPAGLTWITLGTFLDLATIALDEGHPDTAALLAGEGLRQADSLGFQDERVNARIELSSAEVMLHRTAAAVRHAEEAVRIADSLDVIELKVNAREARGWARQAAHDRAALRDYMDEMDLLESWRGRLALGDLSTGVVDLHMKPFEEAIGLLHEAGRDSDAFAVLERARARELRQLMADHGLSGALTTPRDSTLASLRAAWLERKDADEDRQPGLDREIRVLLDRLAVLDRRQDQLYPATAGILPDVRRQLLAGGQGLLTWFWGDRAVFGWWVTRNSLRGVRLGSADSLAASVNFLHDALASGTVDSTWQPAARRVYQQLVAPLAPDSSRRIAAVLDGPMTRIPLEALLPGPAAIPWGTNVSFTYGPSAAVLVALDQARGPAAWERGVLAVGNPATPGRPRMALAEIALRGLTDPGAPLPFAEEEARTIAQLYRVEGSDLLVGREASLVRWRSLSPGRYRYLHFATHAQVSELRPELTRIVLADSGLDLAAIQRLRLNAQLVTLSACETALGRPTRGEGIVGLSQAFLAAGAQGVLVTLWPVDDRNAADFMMDFYRELHGGHTPAAALQAVRQRWIARGGEDAHPSRWSAYVLVGSAGGEPEN